MIFELLVAGGALALATLRRCVYIAGSYRIFHSVAQTVTLTSLAFFMTSGLSTVSGSPAYGPRTAISDGTNMRPWLQPCGTPVPLLLNKTLPRHSVHRALKRVRTQLKVAQNHFRKDFRDVQEIYSKVKDQGQYMMSWLPQKQYEWYVREIWCLEKGKKAERALPRLHDTLQRFAITFYQLRMFRLKSNINVDLTMNRRNGIIDGMHNEILRMLCEVDTAISNLGLETPAIHNAIIVTESTNWAKEGDLTMMLIQDWGVIRLYRDFLDDWIKAFRNATATGPGTCDPNMVRTLSPRPKMGKKGVMRDQNRKRPSKAKKQNRQRKRPFGQNHQNHQNHPNHQNHRSPQGIKRGPPRNRPMKNRQKKLV